ncbi:alpha/beta fold hydrolase [Novosphingobium sp. 9]|uniref:alpha/beta fold hydrolase n=1 Tax=Novosphingobium sp. 9 TaxID=2025349 RepID=UPI0021B528C6|nr:alpha/beta hydrolase [Novosphingobium sp. 9]
MTTQFESRFWTSRDGLKLHYRDYAGPEGSTALPVVCLHGLTRNARDFERLAPVLAEGRRVLCPDMRGRGESEYARDSASYVPLQYIDDLRLLLEEQGINRFIAIGTSMGGLMTMVMAMIALGDETAPKIAGAVLNDIGPAMELSGLERIREYVGQGRSFPTWVHAARGMEEVQSDAHPGQPLDFWIGLAKQRMTVSTGGRIVFDYDMKIAEPFASFDADTQPDLWPAFEALAGAPLLLLHGEKSDLLSAATLAKMQARIPAAQAMTVPRVGHAPTLDEPEVVAAITRLVEQVG